MIPRRLATAICALAALTLAAACGDDPADSVGSGEGGAPVEETSESTLPSSADAATGAGEVTIGDDRFPFEADICALTPVRHDARDYDLYIHGSGRTDGDSYEVEVFRARSDSGNAIETIRLHQGGGELTAGTNVVGEDSETAQLEVSSSLLTGELELVATTQVDGGTGSVDVTCG